MATKKTAKRKPDVRMKKALADINQLVKTQKKLDLDLKKVKTHLVKLAHWEYRG